ncbi:hypothetical protein QL287_00655 [Mycoplasma sp. M6620]|nr:hypothetical protein [Mycoplasma phocimorsus]
MKKLIITPPITAKALIIGIQIMFLLTLDDSVWISGVILLGKLLETEILLKL